MMTVSGGTPALEAESRNRRLPTMTNGGVSNASLGKTILVVEDERIVARDIQRSLADLGYNVPSTASSAEQALRIASEHCPDLVLMDIRIKGEKDGIETASILRERFDVPIVYLTAYADESTIARAKKTEPLGYLLKPVKTNELRSAVEVALFKHEVDKRLRDRERWLTTTMRSIGDAIVSTDTSGRITYMNPIAENLTGWKIEDARGRPSDEVLRLMDEHSRVAVPNPLHEAVRQGRTLKVDGVLIGAGGKECFIADSTAPILSDGGSLLGAVMVFRDVGERRQLERQLERQIELAERLAIVGTTTASFVHEVNNALSCVTANVDVVLHGLREHRKACAAGDGVWMEEMESALIDAQTGAGCVAKVVGYLHNLTKCEPETNEQSDLADILDVSLRIVCHQLQTLARVVRHFGEAPRVAGPSGRLGQVFINLLINAVHALDPLSPQTNELVVTIGTDEEGRAVVEIRDNGCGMKPEILKRAFEPFFTARAAGQGTGLGLSVSNGIVRSLGGTMTLESEAGGGTTARVTLPAGRRASTHPAVAVVGNGDTPESVQR